MLIFFSFLRFDSLSLFLHHASIIPESNILIIEKTKGLILAGVNERLNAKGKITYAFYEETKKPLDQIAIFSQMNFCKNDNSHIKLVEFEELLTFDETKTDLFTQFFLFSFFFK